uniref:Fatty acid-binding protein n=1 Tax=Ixodes ricinus TaxID=34613 RepID=V5HUZ2_IXORI
MASGLLGKWKLTESENFDDFLKELGVGLTWRKLAQTSKPSVELKCDGDKWSIKTSTLLKTSDVSFTLGQEFEEGRIDGVKVKSLCTLDGDKLVQKQFGDKEVTIVRELDNGQLKSRLSKVRNERMWLFARYQRDE